MVFIIVRRAVLGHEGPGVGSPPDPDARGGGATMANSVHLMPLRDGEGERAGTLLPWLTGCPSAHGVPDRLPEPHPLPTARAVVGALVAAHCHGTSSTEVIDLGAEPLACPDPDACARHDLGEISLHSADSLAEPIPLDAPIEFISCRRAYEPTALVAACALARISGPWVVYPDAYGTVCVVWPGDRPEVLAAEWDWVGAGAHPA
jgi:hypothetical protein